MKELLRKFFFSSNGWTAGQYTVFRVIVGLYFLCSNIAGAHVLRDKALWVSVPLTAVGIASSLLFLFGCFQKWSARVLAALWALYFGAFPIAPHQAQPLLVYIMLAHAELPPAHLIPKVGEAHERWSMPQPVHALIWIITVVFYTSMGLAVLRGLDYPVFTTLYLLSPLALFERLRKWIWLLLLGVSLYLLAALGGVVAPLLLVQFYLFDPAWIKPSRSEGSDLVFYDGECGLCHRAVLFAIAEDTTEEAFCFAPLAGETFKSELTREDGRNFPDSILVRTTDERVLVKSRAILRIARRLGGLWRLAAQLAWIVPVFIADGAYDVIANQRKRFFRKPEQACPMVPVSVSARFLP